MSKLLFVCAFAALFSASFGLTCTNPTVEATSFTTQDATIVSQIAFIAEFTLKCTNKASETTPLFAEVDGRLSPVSRIGTDKFQVSKNRTTKHCRISDHIDNVIKFTNLTETLIAVFIILCNRIGQLD